MSLTVRELHAIAETVECLFCGAEVGHPCIERRTGRYASYPHKGRLHKAEDLRRS